MIVRRSFVVVALVAAGALAAACATTDPISSGGGGQSPTTSIGQGGGGGGATVTDGPGPSTSVGGGGPCGDGVCQEFEDCDSCFEDCGECSPSCGDGTCDDATEDCQSCPRDCGACSVCGDGTCQPDEDCKLCYEDCGICACKPDGLEANNGSPTAKTAVSGTDYCDLSVCAGDFDWFKFTIVDGFTAKILFKEGQGDLDLEIYDPSYVNGSYSADDDETVTLSNLDPGTYYARVYGKSMATNPDYCFRVDTN